MVGQTINSLLRLLLKWGFTRKTLNCVYLIISMENHRLIHRYFARIFRQTDIHFRASGVWQVRFLKSSIRLPLRRENITLDWETALSVTGHDLEVKQLYTCLLQSKNKPDLFIDIGANYGTHSLIFMSQGITTVTFEPNVNCQDYFFDACRLNGFQPRLHQVALGDKPGELKLWFPENETWLGTIDSQIKHQLEFDYKLVAEPVNVVTLDNFLDQRMNSSTLVKIDTEGHEYQVLQGAKLVLERCKPMIVFENFRLDFRPAIFGLLATFNYQIYSLPYVPHRNMDIQEFTSSAQHNFFAIPAMLSL